MTISSHVNKALDSLMEKRRLQARYREVFSGPEGEAVLQHLCREAYVYRCTFVKGDPHATALNEGARRLMLSILQFLGRDLSKMIQQAEEHRTNENTL